MGGKRRRKISGYVLLAAMAVFTILFFCDIKFVVAGLNIIVWDILAGGIWLLVRLGKWAGQGKSGRKALTAAAAVFWGLGLLVIIFAGPGYVEKTEPQTHRTFVAEYEQNMLGRGSVRLYERCGPLLLACDVEAYVGEFLLERPEDRQIYISDDGQKIVVAYFFLRPVFSVPLE